MSKEQVYIAKGNAPWFTDSNYYWMPWVDEDKIINVNESIPCQATVTCKGVTDMGSMFNECHCITSLDLSNFNTSEVTNMRNMFAYCYNLTSLDLSNFDTSKVKDMFNMFYQCSSLTSLDLSSFDTSKVTDMSFMLSGCSKLTSLDLSNFNTSNVRDMGLMFSKCTSLASLDVTNFDTSKVEDMGYMFYNCSKLTSLDLSNFDTSNVENMLNIFDGCSNLTTIKGVIDMKSCKWYSDMFMNCAKLKDVKIKNPPTSFNEHWVGLSSSQYTIVDDESDSLKRRNNMFRTTGIEPIIDIYRAPGFSTEKISINYIPADANNDAPKYDKATQEFDGKKDNKEAMSDFNKAVKELSNKLNEIVGKNTEESSPKEEVSKETKAEDHKHTNEEKVQKTINKQRPNSNKYNKLYYILTEFIYQRDFIPAFLWFMEHAYNNVLIAHQHKRRSYKIYKEIVKGGNLIGKCNISESNNEHCYFVLDGSNRSLNDYNYNRQRKAAKLLAKYIIASNTVPYVLNLKYYLENFGDPYSNYVPTGTASVMKRTFTEVYVKTLEKVCFGKDF